MRPTAEQIEFIRRHGISHCPPSATVEMPWRSSRDESATERDIIVDLAQVDLIDFNYFVRSAPIDWKKYQNRKSKKVNRNV